MIVKICVPARVPAKMVASAGQDFPSQTSALESFVSTLSTTINTLPPSATPQQIDADADELKREIDAAAKEDAG